MNITQHKAMSQARMDLLLDGNPWYATLALHLNLEQSTQFDTAATDATTLWYNLEFVEALRPKQRVTLVAHEVLHCALLHIFRQGDRDHYQWNVACDYVVNNILHNAGFEPIADWIMDHKYDGLSAEQVYAIRQHEGNPEPNGKVIGESVKPQGSGTQGGNPKVDPNGQPDPNSGNGKGTQGAPATGQGGNTETDWQIYTEQASAIAKGAGQLPGDAARIAKQARQRPAGWKELTKEFVVHTMPSDYSWKLPNKRFVSQGLYLPGVCKENLGNLVIVRDTSGSTHGVAGAFNVEIVDIVKECRPESITVIDCDAKVKQVQHYTPDDFEMTTLDTVKGGGGTLFAPAFRYIAEMAEAPTAVIFFTDLDNADGKMQEPDYPVLWVVGKNVTRKQPFGELAVIDVNMY